MHLFNRWEEIKPPWKNLRTGEEFIFCFATLSFHWISSVNIDGQIKFLNLGCWIPPTLAVRQYRLLIQLPFLTTQRNKSILWQTKQERINKKTPNKRQVKLYYFRCNGLIYIPDRREKRERSVAGCLLPAAQESGRGPWRRDGFYLMKINNTPSSQMCRLIWIFIFTVNGTGTEWLRWGKSYQKLSDL